MVCAYRSACPIAATRQLCGGAGYGFSSTCCPPGSTAFDTPGFLAPLLPAKPVARNYSRTLRRMGQVRACESRMPGVRGCPCLAPRSRGRNLPSQAGLLGVRAKGLVGPALPSAPRGAKCPYHVAINANADELLRRRLLRTTLAAISANRIDHLVRKHIKGGTGAAEVLVGPLRIGRVRSTGILSHTFVPLAGSHVSD